MSLWLKEHSSRFSRAVLLRHQENRGLAAARNTAFKAATADWAFVLDADNLLFPKAVEACLQLANNASSGVAVIHPWIEIVCKGTHRHDGRSLVSRDSWSREAFLQGNVLDAMALIRRTAWFSVGGYTHIDGGWEDFDFWCKLIEAGFHGLLCPRVLARYHSHARSMTAQSTASNWRPLSRCLQERHPWLISLMQRKWRFKCYVNGPGFGGVERVAHELASVWGDSVYSFDVQRQCNFVNDPLPVAYPRFRLASTRCFGRLHLPLPTKALCRLLMSQEPLHGHLPSPGVLLVLVLARLVRPRRRVTAHWHCFLKPDPGISGLLFAGYQWLALRLVPMLTAHHVAAFSQRTTAFWLFA